MNKEPFLPLLITSAAKNCFPSFKTFLQTSDRKNRGVAKVFYQRSQKSLFRQHIGIEKHCNFASRRLNTDIYRTSKSVTMRVFDNTNGGKLFLKEINGIIR